MADKSKIEWTDASWTPIRARNIKTGKVGWHCEHSTTGCEFCYAEGMNKRLGTGLPFKPGHRKDIDIFLDEKMLLAPLRWKKPRMIFVCSMTDAFAEFVKDEWLDKMFAVMALCPQHTFQVLTKRAERMREYMSSRSANDERGNPAEDIRVAMTTLAATPSRRAMSPALCAIPLGKYCAQIPWPLPNVWLGVSCERQQEADERIPQLLQTSAAIRFVSAEPLLGPIDFAEYVGAARPGIMSAHDLQHKRFLDWVIVGGESQAGARPMHPAWARSIRDQCVSAGVPFFYKQTGEWQLRPARSGDETWPAPWAGPGEPKYGDIAHMERVGKKMAGRLLDGVEWNEFPDSISSRAT